MWIKKTNVKTKKGVYTYVQLIQSKMIQGKCTHRVIANLGRMERLNMETVESLVCSVSSGATDALPMDEITLLPVQSYGVNLLLKHISQNLGFSRFLEDLANYKKFPMEPVYTGYALVSFYTVTNNETSSFFSFLKSNYTPEADTINEDTIQQAMTMLTIELPVLKGLLQIEDSEAPKIHYFYNIGTENPKNLLSRSTAQITVSETFLPADFKVHPEDHAIYSTPLNDLYVSDYPAPLEQIYNFDKENSRYICKIPKDSLDSFFQNTSPLIEFMYDSGQFLEYNGIGYNAAQFEGKTVIILRPVSGAAPSVGPKCREPRECIISSLDWNPTKLLEIYFHIEKYQNYFYSVFLPADLKFLYRRMPEKEIMNSVVNFHFLKFLFLDVLGRAVEPLGLTTEDALLECGKIVTAELSDATATRRFHSYFTQEQTSIFKAVGMIQPLDLSVIS